MGSSVAVQGRVGVQRSKRRRRRIASLAAAAIVASGVFAMDVQPAAAANATTVNLSSSINKSRPADDLVYTATIVDTTAPGSVAMTGTVTFARTSGPTNTGFTSCSAVPVTGGKAVCAITADWSGAGSAGVTATYNATGIWTGSSASITQVLDTNGNTWASSNVVSTGNACNSGGFQSYALPATTTTSGTLSIGGGGGGGAGSGSGGSGGAGGRGGSATLTNFDLDGSTWSHVHYAVGCGGVGGRRYNNQQGASGDAGVGGQGNGAGGRGGLGFGAGGGGGRGGGGNGAGGGGGGGGTGVCLAKTASTPSCNVASDRLPILVSGGGGGGGPSLSSNSGSGNVGGVGNAGSASTGSATNETWYGGSIGGNGYGGGTGGTSGGRGGGGGGGVGAIQSGQTAAANNAGGPAGTTQAGGTAPTPGSGSSTAYGTGGGGGALTGGSNGGGGGGGGGYQGGGGGGTGNGNTTLAGGGGGGSSWVNAGVGGTPSLNGGAGGTGGSGAGVNGAPGNSQDGFVTLSLAGVGAKLTNPGAQTTARGASVNLTPSWAADRPGGTTTSKTVSYTGLPAGFTPNSSTGTVTGSSTVPGTYNVTVTVTLVMATPTETFSRAETFTWTISKDDSTIAWDSANSAVVGGSYTAAAHGSPGSTGAITYSKVSGAGCAMTSPPTVTFSAVGNCVIQADQAADANFNAASSQLTISVGKGSQTISFTSSPPSPAIAGGPTYTVSATASSGLTVAFGLDGSSTGCSLDGDVVTFTGAGVCRVNADQGGSANFNPAAQVQQVITVIAPNATSTALDCSGNGTLAYDSVATCSVTVTDTSGSPTTPTNQIQLAGSGDGTATFSTCTLAEVSLGVASCTFTMTVTVQDTYAVTATALTDPDHAGSTSNVESVKFGPHATSTVVSCSPTSIVAGTPTTCTATVTDTQAGVTRVAPVGTVVFGQSGGGTFSPGATCSLTPQGATVSTCSVDFVPSFGGAHTVTAFFDGFTSGAQSGGYRHRSSSAIPVPIAVTGASSQHPTTTSLSCSPNPVQVLVATTCTAVVTDTMTLAPKATPTGIVNFGYSGGGTLSPASCTLEVDVPNVSAKCSVTFTPNGIAGSKTVQANYAGVPVLFKASGSGSIFVTVTAAPVTPPTPQVQHPTTTSVSCSPSTLPLGAGSTCTVVVTDTFSGATSSPTGTVTLGSSGGGTLSSSTCTLQPSGDGQTSTCQVTFTPSGAKGTKTVQATYAGVPVLFKASGSGSFYLTAT